MAISVFLVEALLPGGGGGALGGKVCKPLPKDEKHLKEWIRNKLKALASLPGRLGVKVAEALPGIIGAILSWILNKAADVKSMGFGRRYWRVALHVYGYEKVRIKLQHIII